MRISDVRGEGGKTQCTFEGLSFLIPFKTELLTPYACVFFFSKQVCIIIVSSLGVFDPTPFMRPEIPKMIWQVRRFHFDVDLMSQTHI